MEAIAESFHVEQSVPQLIALGKPVPEKALNETMARVRSAKKAKREAKAREPESIQEARHAPEANEFTDSRVLHVREQILKLSNKLDALLAADPLDTKRVKEASEALDRLSELERKLAGRPLPGAYRPSLKAKRNFGASRLRA